MPLDHFHVIVTIWHDSSIKNIAYSMNRFVYTKNKIQCIKNFPFPKHIPFCHRVTRQNTELRSVKTECGQCFIFFFPPSPTTLLPSLPSV